MFIFMCIYVCMCIYIYIYITLPAAFHQSLWTCVVGYTWFISNLARFDLVSFLIGLNYNCIAS